MRVASDPQKAPASNGVNNRIHEKKSQLPSAFKQLLIPPKKPLPPEPSPDRTRNEEPLPPEAIRRARWDGEGDEARKDAPAELPTLDPLVCTLSHPRVLESATALAQPAAPVPVELPVEALLERLVRRVAVGGTGKRGTARLELGAGGLDGTTVTIHADEAGEVSVEVELGPGARGDWHEGLKEKLERRGLTVRNVEIR